LLVWRNKKKEHSAHAGNSIDPQTPDTMLMCEKQRNGENEDWYSLWFHKDSHQFVEQWDAIPMTFDERGDF
jgi:twinkle protein